MISKKLPFISFFIAIVTIASLTLLSSQGQHAKPDTESATPVQEGVMTAVQKEHSKLYKGYGTGKKLRELAAEIPTGVKVKRHTPLPAEELGGPLPLAEFIKSLACKADVIVVGTAKNKSSQLTEDGEFVFTDYELNIEDVIKDNSLSHLETNTCLTVTQPGGKILLSETVVEVEDASFKALTIGDRYALFLKFIPQTGTYSLLNSKSSYELRDESVKSQTEVPAHSELKNIKAVDFLTIVRTAAGLCG